MSPRPLPWDTPEAEPQPARPDLRVVAEQQPTDTRTATTPATPEPQRAPAGPPATSTASPAPTTSAEPAVWPGEGEVAPSAPSLHDRIHTGLHEAGKDFVAELRFVRERPNSLIDHIAYARHGEWTNRKDGWQRRAALAWTYTAAIPVSTVAYLSVWAVARPGRAAAAVAAVSTTASALNALPVLGWFIPDWLTIPYWLGI
ncbi:hypothetical protein [Pseudonocardia sp. HH130630-07]|uniref:hypothetical protein n=1 Tax=Pseudonocardia sp. HH130630-07 TaxID=1690815 RepID=UPI000814F59C|nr:hypothetical protein [Pseudonocardia sp. HH130630-07]ANY10628.1 hypothetical protein AFB00_29930 [Pseudonocardia sp. HH130630-07]